MNKFLFAFGFLLTLCNPIYPQEATQNYIRTRVMLNESGSSYMDEIVYYDGLGRPFQTVQKGITPSLQSLISLQEYDEVGRKGKSWLPVTSASIIWVLLMSSVVPPEIIITIHIPITNRFMNLPR